MSTRPAESRSLADSVDGVAVPTWGEMDEALHDLLAHHTCASDDCQRKLDAIRRVVSAFDRQAGAIAVLLSDALAVEDGTQPLSRAVDELASRWPAIRAGSTALDLNQGLASTVVGDDERRTS
ncbi:MULTISPECIES: hypothetical protein [unclassified Nocardia]|uniref:hypothetical protein n=1 Tax=unclassified Nocardia TaxID=2637762 RepID=UPI0024A7C01B|nr:MULTISPECIES: hypothetical protein [unclassified Nocardia]